ncbi:MAG: CDP-alcohol phosphatidyltransferase family protein [Chthoniobacterales bacterium]
MHRVLILADESAEWKVAGLRQLDRLALSLHEYVQKHQPRDQVRICLLWDAKGNANEFSRSDLLKLEGLSFTEDSDEFFGDDSGVDLVLSTRLFLFRNTIAELLANSSIRACAAASGTAGWQEQMLNAIAQPDHTSTRCKYLSTRSDIPKCEREFLRDNGKSQDGLASRYVNRPLSRLISRWLLKLPLQPSTWSVLIFALPICATFFLCRGTYSGFVIGCAIFQLYSILDGCDGEIARAKFLQTEFGRRLDSICDLAGNMLLSVGLGTGLARQAEGPGWFYLMEGVAAAVLTITSEGILFLRRSRGESTPRSARWGDALYQRHHEFLERSGFLCIGENLAWWLVQLTKRDMAMLAFLLLALVGWPQWNLHLLLTVGAISSALAGKAFLRQPAPAVAQEAS